MNFQRLSKYPPPRSNSWARFDIDKFMVICTNTMGRQRNPHGVRENEDLLRESVI
jgi:hypothetical protein